MELKLKRTKFASTYTLGSLSIDGEHFCYTVEDTDRDHNKDGDLDDTGELKIHGETAIPKGTYKVVLSVSNRFKKLMPEVLNVKGFAGIRIHSGNTAGDSEGCIIIGDIQTINGVGSSRNAFMKLMNKLDGQKNIVLTIE